jgi:hypothetical protein
VEDQTRLASRGALGDGTLPFTPYILTNVIISSDFAGRIAKKPLEFPRFTKPSKCRRGEMVDTADLKSVAFKGVPVRVRPAVFFL